MSYCRWSCDQWQSDVYVFHHDLGHYQIHVAGRKRVPHPDHPMPEVTANILSDFDEWCKQHGEQMAWLDPDNEGALWHWEALDSPHSGESYECATPLETVEVLENMRLAGLHVPQHAIDSLMEEETRN